MPSTLKYIMIMTGLVLISSCQRKTYDVIYPTLNDGKYDSEFPYRNCSEQLEVISRSVKKIFCMTDYRTYHLPVDRQLLPADLLNLERDSLLRLSTLITNTFESATGTATIIHYDEKSIMLITCAHIVNAPDTVFTYYDDNDPETIDYLFSISIKFQQNILFTGHEYGQGLNILAMDSDLDLAVIGRKTGFYKMELQQFPYPLGDAASLEWGTFVYLMGYPLGYQMITKGIVSPSAYKTDEFFLVDASFNEGFSGGIVLAIRDGVPNFELVGIGKSASATYENVVVPEKKDYELKYNPEVAYEGDLYVNLKRTVNYGVTKAISSQAIRNFYRKNEQKLESAGYLAADFFGNTE